MIRPKDVARAYMHRFKYYIPNIAAYRQASFAVVNAEQNTPLAAFAIFNTFCVTSVFMHGLELEEFHRHKKTNTVAVRYAPSGLSGVFDGAGHNGWKHETHLRNTGINLGGDLISIYCFDNFSIDNRFSEGGNVLYARHGISTRWAPLTDLAALAE